LAGDLRHIKLWKHLEEKAKEAAKTRQLAEETIEAAEALIKSAKDIDANVADVTALLTEATNALAAKDYKLSHEKSSECREKAQKVYKERIRSILDSNKFLMELVKKVGGDSSSEEEAMKNAEEAYQKDDFSKAIDLAKESWRRSEKNLHERISKMFSNAQSLILTAKNSDKDVKVAEQLLSRAREAMDASDYEMAISSTKECLENIGSALKDDIMVHLDEAKALVDLVRDTGHDPNKLEAMLERVQSEMDNYSYDSALNYAKQTKTDAEKTLGKAITEKLTSFKSELRAAVKIDADVSEVEEMISDAKKALGDGNHQTAVSLINEIEESLSNANFEVVVETISQFRHKFVTATNMGLEIKKPLDLLNASREALKAGEFEDALKLATKSENEIDKAIGEYHKYQTEVDDLQKTINVADEMGVDITDLNAGLQSARNALEDKEFRKFVKYVDATKNIIEKVMADKAQSSIENVRITMELAMKKGLELGDIGETLKDSANYVKEKEYSKAMPLYAEAKTRTETVIKDYITNSLKSMRDTIEAHIPAKEEAKPFHDMMKSAIESLNGGDYAKALKVTEEETQKLGSKLLGELKESLGNAEKALNIAEKLNLDVAAQKEKMTQGTKAIEEKDYMTVFSTNFELTSTLMSKTEDIFKNLKEGLFKVKELDVDIKPFLIVLKEAAVRKKENNLLGAYQKLLECNKKISKILGMKNEAQDLITSTTALITEAKQKSIDVKNVLSKLLEAKKLYEERSYEGSIELSQEAKLMTKKLIDMFEASHMILEVKKKLDIARMLKIDVGTIASGLAKATDTLKNRDYETALKHSNTADVEISGMLKKEMNPALSKLQSMIHEAKEIGIDVTIAEEQFSRSQEFAKNEYYKDAAEAIVNARNEIQRLKEFSKKAASTIKKAQDVVNEVESMNIMVTKYRKQIREAIKLLDAHNYEGALELSDKTLNEMESERNSLISKTIEKFKESIKTATDKNINMKSSEQLLVRAEEAFENNRFKEALEFATQSETEIERVTLQQDMALKSLKTARRKINSIKYPAPKAEDFLEKGEEAFEKGMYTKALEFAIQSGDEFYKVMGQHDETMSKLQNATKYINMVYKLGIKVAKAKESLNKAISSMAEGEFESAYSLAVKSIVEAKEATTDKLGTQIIRFEELMSVAREIGIGTTTYEENMNKVRGNIEEESFETASGMIKENKKKLEQRVARELEELIKGTQDMIAKAEDKGTDITGEGKILEEASIALSEGNFKRAVDLISEIEDDLGSTRKVEVKFAEITSRVESIMDKALKFGLDMKQAEKLLKDAKKQKEIDINHAMKVAEKSLEHVYSVIEKFTPKLKPKLMLKEAVSDDWVDTEVVVVNEGKTMAREISVKIFGNAEFEDIKPLQFMKAGEKVKVPVKVRFESAGKVRLTVKVNANRIIDERIYTYTETVDVEVKEKPESGPLKKVRRQRII
jgi:tetratricopeptide (TPR) repeat protein